MPGLRPFHAIARRILRLVRLLVIAGGSLLPAGSAAQTVSPPIAEYQGRARSSFELSNQSIFPLNVVLEIRGFRVTEQGDVVDAPFDSTKIKLKLSAMSFRIPPRGSYRVFYEATADSLPAWFNILSAISGARTDAGLNVRILLPHVVYLNQKQPLRRDDVAIRSFVFDSARSKVRLQLENTGPSLGRVLHVAAGRGKTAGPPGAAFPLFPHSVRWTELDWSADSLPDRLMLRFAKFEVDTLLAATVVTAIPESAVSNH